MSQWPFGPPSSGAESGDSPTRRFDEDGAPPEPPPHHEGSPHQSSPHHENLHHENPHRQQHGQPPAQHGPPDQPFGYPAGNDLPGHGPDTGHRPAGTPFAPVPHGSGSHPVGASGADPDAPRRAKASRGGPGLGTVVITSVLTAALVGGAAGYGGWKIGQDQQQPGVANSQVPAPPPENLPDTAQVARALLPSTVTISYRNAGVAGTGSGFILDSAGLVMTNNHVVEGARGPLTVAYSDGSRGTAEVVGRSPSYDLAVIRVAPRRGLSPVQLGDSDQVVPGQPVVAVGSPLGLGGSVTSGIVSAVERPLLVGGGAESDASAYINGIQTDAAINPGNSGGPLVDASGRVVGVNSAILTAGSGSGQERQGGNIGVGFAIPINQATYIADQLIRTGKAVYPVLGANVTSTADGVRLTSVTPDGPADAAGLRPDTLITQVEGKPVYEATDLIVRIRSKKPGDTISLTTAAGSTVKVNLGSQEG